MGVNSLFLYTDRWTMIVVFVRHEDLVVCWMGREFVVSPIREATLHME